MLHPGLYEQVINNALTSELSENPEVRKFVVPIDKVEASKALEQYLADVVQKSLDNVLDNGGDISAHSGLTNQIVTLFEIRQKKLTLPRWALTSGQSSFFAFTGDRSAADCGKNGGGHRASRGLLCAELAVYWRSA